MGKDSKASKTTTKNVKKHFGRRSSDTRILHSARRLIAIEKVFNNEVDALLDAIGLTREDIK